MSNEQSKNETSSKQKRKQTWVVMISTIVVLLLIVGIVAIVFQNKDKAPSSGESHTKTPANSTTPHSLVEKDSQISYINQPRMGNADAPVRIAEFGDYKCPICRQFEMDIFPKIKKDFIDTGKAQFYFMNYTIIAQDSVYAANAGEAMYALDPGHFWDYHELLYENQGPETEAWVTNDLLLKLAQKADPKLNVNQFKSAIENNSYIDQIRTDVNMGKAAGVNGTPTVFINGQMVSPQDTFDYGSLKNIIQKAIDGEK